QKTGPAKSRPLGRMDLMTTRTAGRHRITTSPPEPSLLLLDYLESGRLTSGLNVKLSPVPAAPRRSRGRLTGGRLTGGRLTGRRIDWRGLGMATPAVLAGVAVAVVLGGYALLRTPMANGSGRSAVPSLAPPQAALLPPSATPALSPAGPSALSPAGSPAVSPAGPPAVFPAWSPARPSAGQPRPSAGHRISTARRPSRPVPVPAVRPAPRASRSAAPPRGPAIVARYLVVRQGPAGFQGEVQVINNGPEPIAGWQVVIALPEDQVLSFSNA